MTKRAISKCVASFLEVNEEFTKRALRAHVAQSTGVDILQHASVWRPFFTKCVRAYTDPPSNADLRSVAMHFVRTRRSSSNYHSILQDLHEFIEEKMDIALSETARDFVTAEATLQLRSDIDLPAGKVPDFDIMEEDLGEFQPPP